MPPLSTAERPDASPFTLCALVNPLGSTNLCDIDSYDVWGADTAPRYLRFASPLTGWDHPLLRYKLSALVSAQGAAAQAYTLLQVRASSSPSNSLHNESRG